MKRLWRPRRSTRDSDGWVHGLAGLQVAARRLRDIIEQSAAKNPGPSEIPAPSPSSARFVFALLGTVALSANLDRLLSHWAGGESAGGESAANAPAANAPAANDLAGDASPEPRPLDLLR